MIVSKEQINGAMGMLGVSQNELADKTNISTGTISNFFSDKPKWETKESTKQQIVDYFISLGIEFIDGGIRKSSISVVTLEGKDGFAQFRQDVLRAVHEGDADVCISNLDEREFDKWGRGKVNTDYRNEMAGIRKANPDLKFRSLVKKGDLHLSAARHSEYKWVDENKFSDIPFYIYGEKTAMFLFEKSNIDIVVISHPKLTAFYRQQFNTVWDKAKDLDTRPIDHLPQGVNERKNDK